MARQSAARSVAAAITAAIALLAPASPACAQATADFFAGKTVTLLIGAGIGGGYDRWGRTVARHIGRHLPGRPTVVPQNLSAAGGIVATNQVWEVAPRDGTFIAAVPRDIVVAAVTGNPGARFDPVKLGWIGTPTTEHAVCIALPRAEVKTVQDLREKQLIVGDAGAGTGTRIFPLVLSNLLGFKFKLVSGFPGSTQVFLAMERGEVDGICESLESVLQKDAEAISARKVNVLFQGGAEPHPMLKDVPFINDLARSEEERQAIAFTYGGQGIGRPIIAPPGLAPDVLAMLRRAFDVAMKDPELIEDARKQKLTLDARTGEQLAALVGRLATTPRPVVERVSGLMKGN